MKGCFVKIPIEQATKPKDGYVCMTDRWWLVEDGCVLGYKIDGEKSKDTPSPQCNTVKEIVERLPIRSPKSQIVFFDCVYWPQVNYS